MCTNHQTQNYKAILFRSLLLLVYMPETSIPFSTTWKYQSTNPSGETLEDWALAVDFQLLYNPKQSDSFHSRRWNSTTNPDMALANITPSLKRLVLNPFFKSQHEPSLISPVNLIRSIPSKAVKRWNFRKANWFRFTHLVDNKIHCLPDPASADLDTHYTSICKVLLTAAKRAYRVATAASSSLHGMRSMTATTKLSCPLQTVKKQPKPPQI